MTVFKTFWKILNKNKITLIVYTVILLIFGITNMQTNEKSMSFSPEKPDILIINKDDKEGIITKDFIKYLNKNTKVKKIANNEEAINDALFYREVNYVIYIPENFNNDLLDGKNPEIKVKSTGDYQASYAEMIISRYIEVANTYQKSFSDEDKIVQNINETLKKQADIEVTTKLDTNLLQRTTAYYNFSSYSLLACLIMIIGLILNSFNDEKIRKRIIISSTNYRKHNRILLISNCCYSMLLWVLYVIISFIALKDIMISKTGLIYILNSFVFTICVTALSFLLGTLINNKDALSGIANVISLGSSFLCGAFVPVQWLPDFVIKVAHVIPTYYYIDNNERLVSIEKFTSETMKPILNNILIMIGFTILFIILTNIISKKKRKIG